MFAHLPVPLCLRCLGFLADCPADIAAYISVCLRFQVIGDFDALWVAAFSLRNWKRDFPLCEPLIACAPVPVLYDPDNDFAARATMRRSRAIDAADSDSYRPYFGHVMYSSVADPAEPSLLLEWQMAWPCPAAPLATPAPRRVATGEWKSFYKSWIELLRTYNMVCRRGMQLSSPKPAAVHRRPLLLHCELSDEAKSFHIAPPSTHLLARGDSNRSLTAASAKKDTSSHFGSSRSLLSRASAPPDRVRTPSTASDDSPYGSPVASGRSETVVRLALIGLHGSGKQTAVSVIKAYFGSVDFVTAQHITNGFVVFLYAGPGFVLSVFETDPLGQYAVYWTHHCSEWDGVLAMIDGTDGRAMFETIRSLGRLLHATNHPIPPVALCINKQDAGSRLSCRHATAFARCWLPPETLWCAQECAAIGGVNIGECLTWLARVANLVHIQSSPRPRMTHEVANELLRDLAVDTKMDHSNRWFLSSDVESMLYQPLYCLK